MRCFIDHNRQPIRDLTVFEGLIVDDKAKFKELFLHPQFTLLRFEEGDKEGFIIFEEWEGGFIFHLVNFTQMNTQTMTEEFIKNQAIPYCKKRNLNFIQASVERAGMGRKLQKIGFENIGNNVFRMGI